MKYAEVNIEFLQTPIPSTAKWNNHVNEDGSIIYLDRHICFPDNNPDFVTNVWISLDGDKAIMQCCATQPDRKPRVNAMDSADEMDWIDMSVAYGFTLINQSEFIELINSDRYSEVV